MKVDITERQLLAIQSLSETIDAMIGDADNATYNGVEFNPDNDIRKELKFIKRFFNKNGYELDVKTHKVDHRV